MGWFSNLLGTTLSAFGIGPKGARSTLSATGLSADRSCALPDASGTLALITNSIAAGNLVAAPSSDAVASSLATKASDSLVVHLAGAETITGGKTFAETVVTTPASYLRTVQGSYGMISRNDGSNFYLLMTAAGDQYGSWNTLRPFTVNLITGDVDLGHNVGVGGAVTANSYFLTSTVNYIAGNASGTCTFSFRPNGAGSTLGQTTIAPNGAMVVDGYITANGAVANGPIYSRGSTSALYFDERGVTADAWAWYATGNAARLYRDGVGNVVSVTPAGELYTIGKIYDPQGEVRKIAVGTINATSTAASTWLNASIEKSDTNAYTYTIPPSLGTQSDVITFVNSGTAGNLTIARGTGVAIFTAGVDANLTIAPGSIRNIYRSAALNKWIA